MRLPTWVNPGATAAGAPEDPSGLRPDPAGNVLQRLRRRVPRPVINHDDSGSMLLALFAIIILTALVSVVLTATIAQQVKTRKATDFTFAGQAADAAVNDALLMANKNLPPGLPGAVNYYNALGPDHYRTGVMGEFIWYWIATPKQGGTQGWDIRANGCRKVTSTFLCNNTPQTREINATLTAAPVIRNLTSTGEVQFILDPVRGFGQALFADEDLVLQGTTKVSSYYPEDSDPWPGYGKVGTNGLASFGPLVTLDGISMSSTQSFPSGDRCNGPAALCDPATGMVTDIRPRLRIDDTNFIDGKLASCPQPIKPYVASADPDRRLSSGTQCYTSMTFDADIEVPWGTALVYVDGPITVAPGVEVNLGWSPDEPKTKTLKIYSKGTVVNLSGGAGSATETEVAWNLWAPNALCATSSATGWVTAYGSMVCHKIFTQGTFSAKWDYGLAATPAGLAGLLVWETTGYRE